MFLSTESQLHAQNCIRVCVYVFSMHLFYTVYRRMNLLYWWGAEYLGERHVVRRGLPELIFRLIRCSFHRSVVTLNLSLFPGAQASQFSINLFHCLSIFKGLQAV